ncbi:MAG TPA: helix-turn-helix transcriptional regulator, partial [Sphingomicrobium sp.]|nr:helix-turn-helix transcriptional regulator [Sphingomicrobium sp.]
MSIILQSMGAELQRARRARGPSQAKLAVRLGRDRARISELERELASNRMSRDRLTLFAEISDALDRVPVMVPRARCRDPQAHRREGRVCTNGARQAHSTTFSSISARATSWLMAKALGIFAVRLIHRDHAQDRLHGFILPWSEACCRKARPTHQEAL